MRTPSTPGAVPIARVPIDDDGLATLIAIADQASVGSKQLTAEAADLLLRAMPALLRELRLHRRTAALPAIQMPAGPANDLDAPRRIC
jgi:hypothetical protein